MAGSLFRYVALGDSSAVGVGAAQDGGYPERLARRVKAIGVPVGILNLGVSGATLGDLVSGPATRVASKRPHLVTVGIGTNDAWRMTNEEVFAKQLKSLANTLEAAGAPTVVFNVPDLGLAPAARVAEQWVGIPPAMVTQRVRRLNAAFHVFHGRANVEVVDLFSQGAELKRNGDVIFSPDGFHPSPAGYELWASLAWPAVERIARDWKPDGD